MKLASLLDPLFTSDKACEVKYLAKGDVGWRKSDRDKKEQQQKQHGIKMAYKRLVGAPVLMLSELERPNAIVTGLPATSRQQSRAE